MGHSTQCEALPKAKMQESHCPQGMVSSGVLQIVHLLRFIESRCLPDKRLTHSRRTLTQDEQTEYLSAVKCFLSKPGITPKTDAPGAVSRYDDLVATHIHQTFNIHYTVRRTQ